ncbi:DNA polymerase ligase N-terminal domain-containing protein [Dethiobacter alkaliphilus]|uniref:DNA ligase D, 3'-phosphoesterase domain protein n=1 Tax=Dethiobacter alkaliphilus AHT 1 TaxID=555088 RepID=C0GJK5_DETAL|nr:DNA polymerase ligase N-terminal domain-containing protein [Dethiobacter alkaliphilus]EEG76427.1 DNA ligase D, 3'-phosphoesterase domain protein [Dethiobacter alkaliphilus AHT 1]
MSKKKLSFVVQQHDATHMHWDFRLEMDGVLVSWAIPKGPSLNPANKRLAIRVVDHEFSYKDFEGVITGDDYGAGKVIIWDSGYYEPAGADPAADLHRSWLADGKLEFTLYGEKLKGQWALIKTKSKQYGEDSWLLIKKKDEFAAEEDILEKERKSVVSGKSIEEITEEDGTLSSDSWDEE